MGQGMLLVGCQFKADVKVLLYDVADCVKTSVAVCINLSLAAALRYYCLCKYSVYLPEMALWYIKIGMSLYLIFAENIVYPLW